MHLGQLHELKAHTISRRFSCRTKLAPSKDLLGYINNKNQYIAPVNYRGNKQVPEGWVANGPHGCNALGGNIQTLQLVPRKELH